MKIALIVLVTVLAGAIAYPAALPQDAVPEEQGISYFEVNVCKRVRVEWKMNDNFVFLSAKV